MPEKIKAWWNRLKPVLSVAVAAGVLLLIFSKVNWGELKDALLMMRWGDLAIALGLLMLGDFCFGIKSWLLRTDLPFWRVVSATFACRFYALLPGGNMTGEAMRLLKLRQITGLQNATAMMIMDKQSEMIPAMLLCFIGLLSPGVAISWIFYAASGVMLLWPVLIPGLLFVPPVRRWAVRQGQRLRRFRWGGPVADQLELLSGACADLGRNPRRLILHLGFGFWGELCTIFVMVLLSSRLNLPVRPWDYLWINGVLVVALVIPASVMGMGMREGAMVFLLGLWGIDVSRAMSLSLLISSLTIVKGLVWAPVSVLGMHGHRQGKGETSGSEEEKQ